MPDDALHQRAGEGGAAPVADLCPDLLRLHEKGAGKPLGLVDLDDGRFPLGALAPDVGARLGRLILRSRAELLEAGAGGVKSRLKLVNHLAQALPDRVDLLAQPLQVGIGEVAPGERRILLVKLELEGIELAPQRLRLGRDLERRGRRARRSLRRRVGLAEGDRRAEKAGCQDEPDENLAHRSAPLRPIAVATGNLAALRCGNPGGRAPSTKKRAARPPFFPTAIAPGYSFFG